MNNYIEKINTLNDFGKSKFFVPLADEVIDSYELEKKTHIPKSYREWLKITNGCELFGRYVILYGINNPPKPSIGNDFSNGLVPKEYTILGCMESQHICFSKEKNAFFFFEYDEPEQLFENFQDILDYIIDICTN